MNQLAPFVLRGDVLEPGQTVRVVFAPHPLRAERHIIEVAAGQTIEEIVDAIEVTHGSRVPRRISVSIDGDRVSRDMWSRVRVKPGVTVVARALPAFEGGDLLKTVVTVAVILASIVLPMVIFPLGGIAAALLGAGILLGGQLLISALFPVPQPQLRGENKSNYSLRGGQNIADPFGVVPEIFGVHRVWPKLGGQFYTEFVGGEQYLRGLFVWGYGPKRISDIKIGETPISQFQDVQIQTREGRPGDAPIKLYPREVLQTDLSIDLTNAGGWHTRRTASDTDEITLDIVAPGGVVRYNDKGEEQYYTVSVRAEYRKVGASNWKLLGVLDIRARSTDAVRRGLRKEVSRGTYDVRVRKTSADYSGEDRVQETVVWTALRAFRDDPPIEFPHDLAVTAIRIRATDQLSGVIQQLNGIVKWEGRSWSGSSWESNKHSRNPADHYRYVLQSPANARARTSAQVDLTRLSLWHEYCRINGFTYDAVHDFDASVYEVLQRIAAAGRASPSFRDGKWSVIWDDPDAPIVQHFTPRNSWNFAGSRAYRRTPHAWRVRFINENKGWVQDERIVYDDGYNKNNATLYESIEFPGQTNPKNNWRHGRFHLAQVKLRPETYSLNVDYEHLVATRGDRVRVTHDVPMFGLVSGRVKSVSGSTVVVDEIVTMDPLKSYAVRFRLADGSSLLRTVETDDGETTQIVLTGTGGVPAEGDLFLFGEAGTESVVLRVKEIRAGSAEDLSARLVLVDDAPEISAADSGDIPDFDSQITAPVDYFTAAPVNLRVEETVVTTGGVVSSGVVFSWETLAGSAPVSFDVRWRDSNGDTRWIPLPSVVAPVKFTQIAAVPPGSIDFRVRCVFEDGTRSNWATLSGQSIVGLRTTPGDVQDFRVQVIDDQSTLTWSPAEGPVSHYTIRFAPVLTGAAWGSATVLQERVDATSVQVPTLVGSYMIKAVTSASLESNTAALIVSNVSGLRDLNVVETWQADPDWVGTLENVEVDVADDLRLTAVGGVLDWGPVLDIDPLVWTTQFPYQFGLFESSEIVDLGEVFTSRVTAHISAVGDNIQNVIGAWGALGSVGLIGGANADNWVVRIYESHTMDDPGDDPEWSEWVELALRDITARALRFKLHLYSLDPGVTPVVSEARVTIDMPDRVVAGEDITSSASESTRVDFDPPMRALQGLAIVIQDAGTGDRYAVTSKSETGFNIRFYNSVGTGVVRVFDYVAKGYGKQTT